MATSMSVPALRFNGFGDSWASKKLGEITSYVDYRGKTPRKSDAGVFLVTAKNIRHGYIDYKTSQEYIPTETYEEVMRRGKPLIGDVLITTEAPLGYVASVDREGVALAQRVIKLRGFEGKINNGFLKFYLHSERFQKELLEKATGGTVKGIKGSVLHKMEVHFPEFKEQTKIANFLTAVDEKIQHLTQKHDLLNQYKKGVMQKIFSQELRFKDDDGKDFPEWEEKTLDEVCICLDNKRKPLNDAERQTMQGKIPYWGANNIMDYVNDYIFDEPIVLLAEDGGNFNEYKTRPIANISYGKCWVNNHTHVLKSKTGLSNEFLFYSLVHKNITGYVSGGTRAKLTKGEMLKILIDMPSPKEQTKIANFLTAIDDKITVTQTQLQAVKQYKQGLLQQMFV
jgi:type I restriction enzyme S subunit